MSAERAPVVSVVIPCRNERDFIDDCLETLTRQSVREQVEFVIAEGASTDGTRERILDWQGRDARVRLVDNPEGIVPTGLNRAIRESRGEIIVRADVHTQYAENYIDSCVDVLRRTGAQNVGGPWRAAGRGWFQTAIASAFQSPFSSGGARSHSLSYEGPVDSVYLGCWRKTTLMDLELFDDELVRNQDDELNLRIVSRGGTVWQSPEIQSTYFPRPSLSRLFRQYFQYGYWKIRVMQKHGRPAALRHVIPGIALALSLILLVAGLFVPALLSLFALGVIVYLSASVLASLRTAHDAGRWSLVLVLPAIFACFHLGYAAGSMRGVLDFLVFKRGASDHMARLTR